MRALTEALASAMSSPTMNVRTFSPLGPEWNASE
jgi:hypothetical protein